MDVNHQPPELEACGPFVRTTHPTMSRELVADCSMHRHGADYARLFAASPKLLDALNSALESTGYGGEFALPQSVIDEAKAAIADATGMEV